MDISIPQYVVQQWIKKIQRNPELHNYEALFADHQELVMTDGYNYRHINIPILILDSYGDDSYLYEEEYEKIKNSTPKQEVRIEPLFSTLLVDEDLSVALIDVQKDLSYRIWTFEPHTKITIPMEQLSTFIGDKRAYSIDVSKSLYTFRLKRNDTDYLQSLGIPSTLVDGWYLTLESRLKTYVEG